MSEAHPTFVVPPFTSSACVPAAGELVPAYDVRLAPSVAQVSPRLPSKRPR